MDTESKAPPPDELPFAIAPLPPAALERVRARLGRDAAGRAMPKSREVLLWSAAAAMAAAAMLFFAVMVAEPNGLPAQPGRAAVGGEGQKPQREAEPPPAPAPAPAHDDLAPRIAALGSEDFEVRDKAFAELKSRGEAILPRLREALRTAEDSEIRSRLEHLVALWAPGTLLWQADLHGTVSATPVVEGENVYLTDDDGRLYAFSADDGKERWSVQPAQGKVSGPTVSEGRVFVVDAEGEVRAFDGNTGKVLWHAGTAWPDPKKHWVVPLASGKRLYVSTHNQTFCLDAATGRSVWTAGHGGGLALGDGTVYLAGESGQLFALNAGDGKELWSMSVVCPDGSVPKGGLSAVAVRGEIAVVRSAPHAGTFWAISLKEHKVLWAHNAENVTGMWPALDGDRLYMGCNSGRFSAYDLATGKVLWTFAPPYMNSMVPSPVVWGNRVYCAGLDMKLHCLDAQSGKELWAFFMHQATRGSPALAGGLIFMPTGNDRGRLFALRAGASGPASWPVWRGNPGCNGAVEPDAAPKP